MKRIAVYCGSASPADPIFIETAKMVGRTLAERGIGLVYGGGKLGLMGAVANATLKSPIMAAPSFILCPACMSVSACLPNGQMDF